MMQTHEVEGAAQRIWQLFEAPIAGSQFTLARIIVALALLTVLFWVAGRITRWLSGGVLRRRGMDPGSSEEVATLVRYAVLGVGGVVILQTVVGINLTTFVALLGGLGVGLGFGLQNITSNFFSGLIILFERPIKVGDKVRVAEAIGTVKRIAIRATTLMTEDNTVIIVPNSDFISQRVTNWRYAVRNNRVAVRVRVPLDTDPARVEELLVAAVKTQDWVNNTPAPSAVLLDMSDGWQHYELRAWSKGVDVNDELVSRLNVAAWAALKPIAHSS